MKLIVNVFFRGFLCSFLALIISVSAAQADEPLMVIRFNQKIVAYQDKLFYAVREAVKAKPTVVFDVVDVSQTGTPGHGQQVANDIARIGVSPGQINFRPEVGNTASEEVRIFVR